MSELHFCSPDGLSLKVSLPSEPTDLAPEYRSTVSPQTPRKPTYPQTPTPLPSTPLSPASSPKFGNPTPIGLCGFLLANTPATIMLLGWRGAGGNNGNQSAAIGAYFYLGCLLEIICGIGEWINGETFNATVFLVLGGYFGASAAVMVPFYNAVSGYGTDVDAAEAAYYASYATFLISMAVVLLFFTIASPLYLRLARGIHRFSSLAGQTQPEYGQRLSFYDPARSHACGQGSVSGNESNAISFHTSDVPAAHLCWNLNETFSQPNKSYTTGGYSCLGDNLCGINYTISGVENFNVSANYSSMYYQYFVSGGNVEDAVGTVGFFQVQTYGAENCMQGGPDDGRSLYPWVRWSCQSEGDCTTLPYNIKSIGLNPTDKYNDDDNDQCYIANALGGSGVYEYLSDAKIGAGTAIQSATWIVVGMAFVAGAMTLL
ncbi:hypothetical protein KC331_g12149 [Hortaea werneckii]|nr:hypothetical protein KC331_g12149 [Hortaea werneckii]